ncbi:MAG: hypothetical protein AAFR59_17515, partial [Bacteroidota bacterium]
GILQDSFGFSLALNGDGTRFAASTYPLNWPYTNISRVKVYDVMSGNWTQMGSDIIGFGVMGFGYDIDMSHDGQRIVIGDPDEIIPFNYPGGGARVFHWDGTDWVGKGFLSAPGDPGDFGFDVKISGDGSRIVVGDPYGSLTFPANGIGVVNTYEWNGTGWIPISNISGTQTSDRFGYSVDLSYDGSRMVVGAKGDGTATGYAKVFEWDGSQWVQMGPTIDSSPFVNQAGFDVAINSTGDRIAVASPNYNPNSAPISDINGAVKVLDWNGAQWNQVGNIVEGYASQAAFGPHISLSASGHRLGMGFEAALAGQGIGALYELDGNTWVQVGAPITGSSIFSSTGQSVALSPDGNTFALGSPGGNAVPSGALDNRGHVRVYSYRDKVVKVTVQ